MENVKKKIIWVIGTLLNCDYQRVRLFNYGLPALQVDNRDCLCAQLLKANQHTGGKIITFENGKRFLFSRLVE